MAVSNRDVLLVQRCYPQIYLACHTRHGRRRRNDAQLTPQESTILAHLSEHDAMRAADLARHLGVVASTTSAAIKRLTALGFIVREPDSNDRRAAAIRLSRQGVKAMQASSVLEPARVSTMLARLSAANRARALAGLQLLADAASAVEKGRPS